MLKLKKIYSSLTIFLSKFEIIALSILALLIGIIAFLISLIPIGFLNPDPLNEAELKEERFITLAYFFTGVLLIIFSILTLKFINRIFKVVNSKFHYFLIILFLNSFIYERYFVKFPEFEYLSKDIPSEFSGYRITIISDLHYGKLVPDFWLNWIINKTNETNPDIILGLGDYVLKSNTDKDLKIIWPFLSKFKAKDGEFFINGNHESWADHNLSKELLKKSGKSIRNSHRIITKGNSQILIGGTGDLWSDKVNITQALSGSPKYLFKILATHNPDTADLKHEKKINLWLAGHTHGGQVRIPFFDYAPVLPIENKEYDKGFHHNIFGEDIFISSGIGWSILPIRFFCRAEIPTIILKKDFSK